MTMTIGALTLYPYGLCVAVAALCGLLLFAFLSKKRRLNAETTGWMAVLTLPLCVLCARLGYCLTCWGWSLQRLEAEGIGWLFRLTEGGFMLYGALAGGLLAAWLVGRITHQRTADLLDTAAAPAALVIALCRLAEGLVVQGYGWDMEDWFWEEGMSLFYLEDPSFFLRFPFGIQEPVYDTWHWSIFLLEALIGLVICVVLLCGRKGRSGDKALTFLLLYAASQALCESLRQDAVLRWGFVRVSQVISAVMVAVVLLIWCLRIPGKKPARVLVTAWVGTLCCMLIVIAMEFGVEKKIVFLEWLPMGGCYLIMAAACAGLVALGVWVRNEGLRRAGALPLHPARDRSTP